MSPLNPFKRRQQSPTPEQLGVSSPEQQAELVVDPFTFVESQTRLLDTSTELWRRVAHTANELHDDQHAAKFAIGLDNIYRATGVNPDQESRERDQRIIAEDMSIYLLITAREMSRSETKNNVSQILTGLFDGAENNVRHVIQANKSLSVGFTNRLMKIMGFMEQADGNALAVLDNFVAAYSHSPDSIDVLAQLYRDGIGEADAHFRELRAMINLDWNAPNPEDSVLKNFIAQLRHDPHVYRDGYIQQVESSTHGRTWMQVRQMAEFATAAVAEGDKVPTIGDVLRHSYPRWHEFSDIASSFGNYAGHKIAAVEKSLAEIAGPIRKRNIRAFRSTDDVMRYRQSLSAYHGRQDLVRKRKQNGVDSITSNSGLPTVEDIELAEDSLAPPEPRALAVIKSNAAVGSGRIYASESAEIGDLLKTFGVRNNKVLENDIIRMIARLQVEPISRATVRLRSLGSGFKIDGETVSMWRFAPEDCQGLNVSGENRYHRIVYGFNGSTIFIHDILDHGTFDKKYG